MTDKIGDETISMTMLWETSAQALGYASAVATNLNNQGYTVNELRVREYYDYSDYGAEGPTIGHMAEVTASKSRKVDEQPPAMPEVAPDEATTVQ